MYKYLIYIDLIFSLYFGNATCFKKEAELHKAAHEVSYFTGITIITITEYCSAATRQFPLTVQTCFTNMI